MTTQTSVHGAGPAPLTLRRFTLDEYHRMGDLGILTPEDQVELLEGLLVEKMNQRPIHGYMVRRLNELFLRSLPDGWLCQCQLPITTLDSEPEPDVAIVRGNHADFRERHPCSSDCELVIEVADTSLAKDRLKAAIYAAGGVREFWIVNIPDRIIERYSFSLPGTVKPEIQDCNSRLSVVVGDKTIVVEAAMLFN